MLDLLVIGAGLAGLAAALRAAEAGLRVKVIAKGMGALYWAPGTLDVLGYVGVEERAVEDPWQRIGELDPSGDYAVYCRSGNRSAQAAAKLIKMGYTNVYDFGGIKNWTYETESGEWIE